MGMNPKLLRPRSTVHPEAAAWANRVRANGGSVSGATLNAVSKFCVAIQQANIRSRFYRLNLFCGTGLSACLVPLYRGQSLGGTQHGNATDANSGPFVSGDFSEASGLQGNGSTKCLETGIAQTYAGTNEIHKSLGFVPNVSAGYQCAIGGRYNLSNSMASEIRGANANFRCSAFSSGIATSAYSPSSGRNSMLLNHSSSNMFDLYSRGSLLQSLTLGSYNAATTANFLVFAGDTNGTPSAHFSGSVDYYSLGLRFTSSAQVAAFHSAIAAFRVAMGRT